MTNLLKQKFLLGVTSVAIMFIGVFATTVSADCSITLTLRVGSRGVEVQCLQSKLGITADGSFGPKTRAAVIAFQANHQLIADGIFGARSRTAWAGGAVSGNLQMGGTNTVTNSTKFKVGDRFQNLRPVYALNTPGYTDGLPPGVTIESRQILYHTTGDRGTILEGLVLLPAESNNYTWRKVDFDTGADGWVDESSLVNSATTTIPTTTTTTTTITPTTSTNSRSAVDLKINDSDGPYTFKLNSNPIAKLTWTSTGIVNGTCKIDNLRGEKGTTSFKELSLSGYTYERVGSGEIVLTCSENSNFDSSNNPQDTIRIYDDNPDVSSSCLTSDFDDRRNLRCGCNSTSGFSKTTGKSCRIESYGE